MDNDISTLLDIMRRLRDPVSGCPWDLQQRFETIAPYTIEEAYEVADAIDRRDLEALRDELGDLLLQVVFHSQMAAEQEAFGWDDVVAAICDKMIRRHPHVFSGAPVRGPESQRHEWESAKERERARRGAASLMDEIPLGMGELQRAIKLQKRAARAGFDWAGPEPVVGKLREETAELMEAVSKSGAGRIEEELGDLLFTVVNLARKLQVDPGSALRKANAKFERRFRALERLAGDRLPLENMNIEDLEALWVQVKAAPEGVTDE